jgi:hypothetical protein
MNDLKKINNKNLASFRGSPSHLLCRWLLTYEAGKERHFHTNRYKDSFEWKEDEISLDLEEKNGKYAEFRIFLSTTGKFWIDDIRITTDPPLE